MGFGYVRLPGGGGMSQPQKRLVDFFGPEKNIVKNVNLPLRGHLKYKLVDPFFWGGMVAWYKSIYSGGNSFCFYVHPETWGRWSNLTNNIVQMGWFNHQLAMLILRDLTVMAFNGTLFRLVIHHDPWWHLGRFCWRSLLRVKLQMRRDRLTLVIHDRFLIKVYKSPSKSQFKGEPSRSLTASFPLESDRGPH